MPAEGNVGLAFGLVIAAGLSTTIGSTFAFCSNFANRRLLAGALGCSAGVMMYVSFVEIFAKGISAFEESGYDEDESTRYATFCFFGGILTTWLLDKLVHRLTGTEHHSSPASFSDISAETSSGDTPPHHMSAHMHPDGQPALCCDPVHVEGGRIMVGEEQLQSTAEVADVEGGVKGGGAGDKAVSADGDAVKEKAKALERMSLMTGLAIAIHNFPEGLATFVAALADSKLGASIALAIALHNIPEGICVAMPVYYATGSRWKGFWWSFLSGVSEPIGGLFGYFILYGDNMSELAYGVLFGMMVYISMKELIPTAHKYDPVDSYVTNWVFVGMALMAASLLMFSI